MTDQAIITGDLVHSRQADAARVDQAIATLRAAAGDWGKAAAQDTRFARFRGDGWQIHVTNPNTALEVCLFLHARLRAAGLGIDTRMAVGIGPVHIPPGAALAAAHGDAFVQSGDALDAIGRDRLVIAGARITPGHHAIFALIAYIAFGWTAAQAEAIGYAIFNPRLRQEDIAHKLNISRQAVQMRLAAAGWSAIQSAIAAFRTENFQRVPAS